MYVRPTIPPPILHVSGTTVGVSAAAIRAAMMPVTITGRIKQDMKSSATPPGELLMDRAVIGSAICVSALLETRFPDADAEDTPTNPRPWWPSRPYDPRDC